MKQQELNSLLEEILGNTRETEWIEYKHNNSEPQEIGEYISCLSNSACLHDEDYGYIVWGIEDDTLNVVGTTFKPKTQKRNNQEIENWLSVSLEPKIYFEIFEFDYLGKQIVIFRVPKTSYIPVKFSGQEYIRVGSYKKKLKDHPEIERRLWDKLRQGDWSAQICDGATINDLDPVAIRIAKTNYLGKHPTKKNEIENEWDSITFLNKSKVTIQGQITNSAILLLGKEESVHFINPSIAQITWTLKNPDNSDKSYLHFNPPFIITTEEIFDKIRNEIYRYIPDETLFPKEIKTYEPYVIREALHNCIAHNNYELNGRITVVEKPDELIFTNLGSFLPGSIENVINSDSPPLKYHNSFLTGAMVNLNMIDTIGSGIKRMFMEQRKRFFPMPTYDLKEPEKVVVTIHGKVLDINFSRLLNKFPELDLNTVIMLDKIQKNLSLSDSEIKILKKKKLIDGKKPNYRITASFENVKDKLHDNDYFKKQILKLLENTQKITREQIDKALFGILPSKLDPEQKKNKINNLINSLANKDKKIKNIGSKTQPIWVKNL